MVREERGKKLHEMCGEGAGGEMRVLRFILSPRALALIYCPTWIRGERPMRSQIWSKHVRDLQIWLYEQFFTIFSQKLEYFGKNVGPF